MKIKDEYKDLDDKINMHILSVKQNDVSHVKLPRSSLTSAKKNRTGRSNSIDNPRILQPKKLFHNNNGNYILPPIKK